MKSFSVFFEEKDGADTVIPLPADLQKLWGGDFRVVGQNTKRARVIANFVETLDGRISYAEAGHAEGGHISEGNLHDRLTMAILRTIAGATCTGANTLKAEPNHLWTPEYVCPEFADSFARLRTTLGLSNVYTTIFLTRTGDIVDDALVFNESREKSRVLVFTTTAGSNAIPDAVKAKAEISIVEESQFESGVLTIALTRFGISTLLCEGPAVFGSLLSKQLVDEIFLTLSPKMIGGNSGARPGLLEKSSFPFDSSPHFSIKSERAADDYRFFRYRPR